MTTPAASLRAIAVAPDLMDASKLRSAGIDVVRGLGDAAPDVDLVIIDLDRAELPPGIAAWECRVVGFGRHTDPERLDAARSAGVDDVMARSVFFKRLAEGLDAL